MHATDAKTTLEKAVPLQIHLYLPVFTGTADTEWNIFYSK